MHHTSLTLAQSSDMEKLKEIRKGEHNMVLWVGIAVAVLLVVWIVLRGRSSKR
ncbi:MAG: hypothetical protein ACREJO_13345 [Phycisphaerales bacterium]